MNEIAKVFGEGMTNKVTLVIPSTTDVDIPLSESTSQEFKNRALRFLSELYGGATAITATGAWISQNGELVTEPVILVYSFTEQFTSADLMKVRQFCETLRTELRQEAVAVEINGKLIFV